MQGTGRNGNGIAKLQHGVLTGVVKVSADGSQQAITITFKATRQ